MDERRIEILVVFIAATALLASVGGAAAVLSKTPTTDPPLCGDDRPRAEQADAD